MSSRDKIQNMESCLKIELKTTLYYIILFKNSKFKLKLYLIIELWMMDSLLNLKIQINTYLDSWELC